MPRGEGGNGRRSITRLGQWLLVLSMVLVAIGLMRGDVWLFLVALFAVSAVVVSWFALPRLPHLAVSLVLPQVETLGVPTRGRLVLRVGRSALPRHAARLSIDGDDEVHDVVIGRARAGELVTVELVLHPSARGLHHQARLERWTPSPFDLVRRTHVDTISVARTVAVALDDGRAAPASGRDDDGGGPMHVGRTGVDIHALRAWAPGDGAAVHWRTTVRRGTPVVVDREYAPRTSLVVVAGPSVDTVVDSVLARAAGIALSAAREGADVVLVSAQGTDVVTRDDAPALREWTATAQPSAWSTADVARARTLAGSDGRIALVRGRRPSADPLGDTDERAGARIDEIVVDAPPPRRGIQASDECVGLPREMSWAVLASLAGGLLSLAATAVLDPGQSAAWAVALGFAGFLGLFRPATFADVRVRTGTALVLLVATGAITFLSIDTSLPLAAATAVCGVAAAQLVSSRTRRDGLVALGLGPVMTIAAAGLAPGPALAIPMTLTLVVCLVGLAAAADLLVERPLGPVARAAPANPASARSVPVAAIAATAALGLVAFLALPLGASPVIGRSLLSSASVEPSRAEQAAATPPDYFNGALDLDARGHLGATPVYQVSAVAGGLWRAMTLDTVDGGVWTAATVGGSYQAGASGAVVLPASEADSGAPTRPAHDYEVRPALSIAVIAPGPVTQVTGSMTVTRMQSDAYVVDDSTAPYGVRAVPEENVDQLSGVGVGTDRTDPVFVSLDSDDPRQQALAESLVRGAPDRVAAVRAVEAWLRANIRYQLDAPLPPDGVDPVDFLLFTSRAGFCEHFAAAEVTLLRRVGIPSRIATGYAVNEGDSGAPGWFTLRESDAHAWVEVWIPGHGWVTSDPTAGSTLLDASDDLNLGQRAVAAWTAMWSTDDSRRRLAVVVLALAVAAAAIWVTRRRRGASGRRGVAGRRGPTTEPLAAFARHRAALALDGPAPPPGDGVARVRATYRDDPQVLAALDIVERTLYHPVLPSARERIAAAELLDRRTATIFGRRTTGAPPSAARTAAGHSAR